MKKTAGLLMTLLLTGAMAAPMLGSASAEELDSFSLDEYYVTATGYEKKDLSIPASTEVFTRERLEEMDCRSVMDVMANIPGFIMSESPSGNGYPGIRGINSHMCIMVNGVPLAKDYYFQMGTMSTAGIDRIEVVKGGSAVLYGSSATTGVINIITNKGNENRIKVGAGSKSQKLLSGYAGNKEFSVSYDFYDTTDSGLSYDASATRKVKYWRDKIKRTNYSVQFNPTDKVNVMFLHNDKYARSGIENVGSAARGYWENKTRYDMLQASYSDKDFQAIAYYQDRKWDYDMVNPKSSPGIESGKYYGLNVKNKWNVGKTALTVGGEYEYEKQNNWTPSGGTLKHSRNHGSLYFLTDTEISAKTGVIFGAREVFTGSCGNSFNPQLQILQKATDKDSFYINVNKSLLEPPVSYRFHTKATTLANPDLKPEVGWTYEVGYKKQVSDNGLLKFDVFHMDIKDRMYSKTVMVDGQRFSMYDNANKFRNTGAEISYEWSVPKGLSYGIGLTLQNPEQITKAGSPWAKTESKLGGHADLTYRLGKTTIAVNGNYLGSRTPSSAGYELGHLLSVDANAVYKMTSKDTISLKVNNVLDRLDSRSNSGGSVLPARSWLLSYERKF